MPTRRGQRQRGQTIAIAAVAMVAIVGGLAMVIDAGIFLVVQRQFQAAADAGALAAAWYDPICLFGQSGCEGVPQQGAPSLDPVTHTAVCQAGFVACDVAQANANTVAQLCGGSVPPPTIAYGTQLNVPARVNTIVVTVACDAGYSFGRILNLTTKRISASAAAGIGDRAATLPTCKDGGDMSSFTLSPPSPPPVCGRLARLII